MPTSVCIYFQVHQPFRMRPFSIFEVGEGGDYFDDPKNQEICLKVAEKCYLPANQLMLELCQAYPDFRLTYSISGVALEQFARYSPATLESFQKLVQTGQVELLCETSHHSLAALFSPTEFAAQVELQRQTLKKYFKAAPTMFRNTELIYSDAIAEQVASLGFQGMLLEGAERVLEGKSPGHVYQAAHLPALKLLLKNYKLSDDIAFRFSQTSWSGYPLTAAKYAHWLHQLAGQDEVIGLFMDYETIGEHQWADTGIFDFFRQLPEAVWQHPDFSFATPSEVVANYPARGSLAVPEPVSWADTERDVSAWLGNPMQDSLIAWLYRLEAGVKKRKNRQLLEQWRRLQTSDHFYYMCTKYWNDGDVHKYFSVYDAPHRSYVIMNSILTDLERQL